MYDSPEKLIGKKINRIFMNEEYLKFETDGGSVIYTVEGDCCSNSMFYDFIGVRKLLENGPVIAMKEIDLNPDLDEKQKAEVADGELKIYGYAITTESPEFGEMTSVFSFRNYSNGYYGGWMNEVESEVDVMPEITDDVLETVSAKSL